MRQVFLLLICLRILPTHYLLTNTFSLSCVKIYSGVLLKSTAHTSDYEQILKVFESKNMGSILFRGGFIKIMPANVWAADIL